MVRRVAWKPMTRVLSGIQPTGDIHIGNYVGAIRRWAVEQYEHDAFHLVVDLHALTIPRDPEELRSKTLECATLLIACGLDPDVCTLFVQSQVPQHPQLTWLLECTAAMGELRRMTQFKDKASKGGEESARVGLFTYPVLQAADILLYDADEVPVGDDQRQHIELCRDLAERFNTRYGQTFVVPKGTYASIGHRIQDLQMPQSKMSKSAESDSGVILLLEPEASIAKKIKRAVTDTETEVRYDPEAKPGVSNLLELLSVATGKPPLELAAGYTQYGPLKTDTADAVVEMVAPIQERYAELAADPAEVKRLLAIGADKAEAVAAATLDRAKSNIGLLPR